MIKGDYSLDQISNFAQYILSEWFVEDGDYFRVNPKNDEQGLFYSGNVFFDFRYGKSKSLELIGSANDISEVERIALGL